VHFVGSYYIENWTTASPETSVTTYDAIRYM